MRRDIRTSHGREPKVNNEQLLLKLTIILRDLLADDSLVLGMDTRRSDVPNWDSFAYVNFIVATEMELGIRFSVADVESFETVGEIVASAHALRS
jgi:acyl carrier protein